MFYLQGTACFSNSVFAYQKNSELYVTETLHLNDNFGLTAKLLAKTSKQTKTQVEISGSSVE